MKKILAVMGTRPQYIKSGMLSKRLEGYFEEVLVDTGQHYDKNMADVFIKHFKIKNIKYCLGINKGTHAYQTGNMIIKLDAIMLKEKPDFVLVYGDTNSTISGALTAAKLFIPIIHIEAGPRSYFAEPEEVNRVVTDRLSTYLFCPTKSAVANLAKEGITKNVYMSGDIMYDLLLHYSKIAEDNSKIMQELKIAKKEFMFITMHRPLNVDDKERLQEILSAVRSSQEKFVFPIHPRTKNRIKEYGLKIPENIIQTRPLGYTDTIVLEKNAKKVITDSGGIQKEAYFLSTPCLILNDTTPWPECVEEGNNIIVGGDSKKIIEAIKNFDPKRIKSRKAFGKGDACQRIASTLKKVYD